MYFLNGMFDYDKQGEKRRKRGAANALNVKEDCGHACKDSHAVGSIRKKQCCKQNYNKETTT